MGLTWQDAEEIGIQLFEKFPQTDPLGVRFTDLHRWVTELDEFEDDAKKSNEKILEAIQMAWLEEYRDARG
ncbi:MAG: Fe-S cluster assembly protein IscX [Candidatus Tectomicrobia bacterium]|nr:Fe-S cluster assembly protein IscX [Candidatus Tectomicrobia bacterium]